MKKTIVKFTLALIVLLILVPPGCAVKDPAITQIQRAGKVAVAKATTRGALKLQTTKDANAVNKANGKESPATHPLAATNNTVAELHTPLLILTIVFGVAFAVAFGLSYTRYQLLNPLVPALRMTFVLFAVALFTLPFMPMAIFAIIGAAVGLFIYELIRAKGNVRLALEDEETDLGFGYTSNTSAGATNVSTGTKA